MKKVLKYSKIRNVKSPQRGTIGSAGIDFFVPEDQDTVVLGPGESVLIPSGLRLLIPEGYALVNFNKSGVATKRGLIVGACVIDEDYRGEAHLHLVNASNTPTTINPGDKILQSLLIKVPKVGLEEISMSDYLNEATETTRGEGGFGSTGTR